MRNLLETIGLILIFLALATCITWGILANFNRINKRICNDYRTELKLETRFIEYGGCLINVDDKWLSPSTYQKQIENEGYALRLK